MWCGVVSHFSISMEIMTVHRVSWHIQRTRRGDKSLFHSSARFSTLPAVHVILSGRTAASWKAPHIILRWLNRTVNVYERDTITVIGSICPPGKRYCNNGDSCPISVRLDFIFFRTLKLHVGHGYYQERGEKTEEASAVDEFWHPIYSKRMMRSRISIIMVPEVLRIVGGKCCCSLLGCHCWMAVPLSPRNK